MANTTYADYQILFSGQKVLDSSNPGDRLELVFDVVGNMKVVSDARRPILAFHARVDEKTTLVVDINSQDVLRWTLDPDRVKGLWQPWPAGTVLKDFDRPVMVRFSVPVMGRVAIENVVMWFQVEDTH
jgi:hypothetical protein